MAKLKPTLEALNTKIGAGKNQIRNLENWSEEYFKTKQTTTTWVEQAPHSILCVAWFCMWGLHSLRINGK